MEKETVWFQDLGEMGYRQAWAYQEHLLQENVKVKSGAWRQELRVESRESGGQSLEYGTRNSPLPFHGSLLPAPDSILPNPDSRPETQHYLLFVEHPPVYTLGKNGKTEHVLINEEERRQRGIEFYHTNRGGDITFHGPAQIVGYPILDLEKFYTDIGRYLRDLEEVIIHTLAYYGIMAGRSAGETGVWIDAAIKGRERKICAMGVRCSRWITMHGFALNVNTDLDYFNYIIPCGIQNKKVTSLKEELGEEVNMDEVKKKLKEAFEEVFNVELRCKV